MLFFLHFTPDAEIPGGGVETRHRAVMEHGELERERLAGRQAPFAAHALLFLASVGAFKIKHLLDS